jgi:hypothetical protein
MAGHKQIMSNTSNPKSALFGLLKKVTDLGAPLLSVNPVQSH